MSSKLLILILNLLCCLLIQTNADESSFVQVKINNGIIRGVKMRTIFEHKEYIAFRGIPYAKPPLGNLRFLPPVKPDNWTGILDTTEFRSNCTQIKFLQTTVTGSEDCLYLNVYVPIANTTETLSVMFYTHGGGYFEGSGETRLHGPDFLLENDVILVTSNFRLAIFGFLSLGDDLYSGNMAMKDQLLALKWTNENIGFFNGDKKRITIFGHSSGAAMIHMMTIAPDTKGLFHRAIILGSSAFNRYSINYSSHRKLVFNFAQNKRNISSYEDVIEFLQTCDSEILFRGIHSNDEERPGRRGIRLCYTPTIESKNAISPFFTDFPENILESEPPRDIDIMFGITEYEMLFVLNDEYNNPKLLEPFNEQFEIYLPNNKFDLDYNSPVYRNITNEVREFYFGPMGTINQESFIQYVRLLSDIVFSYGIQKSVLDSLNVITGKTYYLKFMVDAKLNVLKQMFGMGKFRGTSHGDELGYIFKCDQYSNEFLSTLEPDSVERKTINRITTLLTNFAKHGDPTPNSIPVEWLPITKNIQNYLVIDNDGIWSDVNPNHESYTFWDNLFEKYRSHSQPLGSASSPIAKDEL